MAILSGVIGIPGLRSIHTAKLFFMLVLTEYLDPAAVNESRMSQSATSIKHVFQVRPEQDFLS